MTIRKIAVAAVAAAALGLAACTPSAEETSEPTDSTTAEETEDDVEVGGAVTLVTHDSFYLPDEVLASFTEQTGYEVTLVAPGDGGELTNQLILTADSPLGDVVYGIDNTFASRAVDEGVFEPFVAERTPEGIDTFGGTLTPIDEGEVCINVDLEWFATVDSVTGVTEPPTSFEDLTDPAYADLTVVTNPATSSPGMAFMLATVGHFGEDGWLDYWTRLVDNGVKIAEGWEDAYYVDFSGSEGEGPRPIVLSYVTSPASELNDEGQPRTAAVRETCFRQTEYAGVIAGTENLEGAQALVDFLLSDEAQAAIPEAMWMFPVISEHTPADWAEFAPLTENPVELDPALIAENRTAWLEEWLEALG